MLSGIVEFLGWFGAVTVLAGYILFSTGKLPNGPVYQLFNLVGGLAVAVNVAAHHAIPSTIVNGIWAVVAVVVLVKMARARRAAARGTRETQPAGLHSEPAPAHTAPAAPHTVLHTEPPATTAVLPIIGPALRDHEPDPAEPAGAEPRLQAEPAGAEPQRLQADPAGAEPQRLQAEHPATSGTDAPVAAAPMTESVPVITATIALALVAAARDQAAARPAEAEPQHADPTTA